MLDGNTEENGTAGRIRTAAGLVPTGTAVGNKSFHLVFQAWACVSVAVWWVWCESQVMGFASQGWVGIELTLVAQRVSGGETPGERG